VTGGDECARHKNGGPISLNNKKSLLLALNRGTEKRRDDLKAQPNAKGKKKCVVMRSEREEGKSPYVKQVGYVHKGKKKEVCSSY